VYVQLRERRGGGCRGIYKVVPWEHRAVCTRFTLARESADEHKRTYSDFHRGRFLAVEGKRFYVGSYALQGLLPFGALGVLYPHREHVRSLAFVRNALEPAT